jgi:hypothetical protein
LNLNLTGTLKVQHWGPWSTTSSFYFAMSVKPTASGDPVATSRIFAMPLVAPNPSLGISGVPGIILGPIANWLASMAASMIEGMINQSAASQVPPALANLPAPLQPSMLTPTAVVSAVNVVILPSGIDLVIAIGDLFGPGLVPIPGNLTATMEPAGQAGWQG